MAEGDVTVYNRFFELIGTADIDLVADTIKITLHTSYTIDIDAHEAWLSTGVSTTEYGTGSGYTAGGLTLGSKTHAVNDTNDRAEWDFTDPTWSSLGPLSPNTPSHAIIWDDTPTTPVADPLICAIEVGSTPTNGSDYGFTIPAAGILHIETV